MKIKTPEELLLGSIYTRPLLPGTQRFLQKKFDEGCPQLNPRMLLPTQLFTASNRQFILHPAIEPRPATIMDLGQMLCRPHWRLGHIQTALHALTRRDSELPLETDDLTIVSEIDLLGWEGSILNPAVLLIVRSDMLLGMAVYRRKVCQSDFISQGDEQTGYISGLETLPPLTETLTLSEQTLSRIAEKLGDIAAFTQMQEEANELYKGPQRHPFISPTPD